MFRFIHTSDWHLGKPFGGFPEDLRGRLREARHGMIARVAAAARAQGAAHVLVAGDIWDSATPSDPVLAQALDALGAQTDLTWVLMPGNHDPARPGGVWERVARRAAPNLILATEARPIEIAPGVVLLPCPPRSSAPGRDLTDWLDTAPTPPGALRLGLAHGGIRDFAETPHSAVLAPDRAARAGLDYLGLGDWHGRIAVAPATWYSGTPEPDRFKDNAAGGVLAVALSAPGAAPQVTPLATARFAWIVHAPHLAPGTPPDLPWPAGVDRRDVLFSLAPSGALSLADRAAWDAALAALAPSCAHLDADLGALTLLHAPEDLDRIDRGGALRVAAEALRDAAPHDPAAAAALTLLYSWCVA